MAKKKASTTSVTATPVEAEVSQQTRDVADALKMTPEALAKGADFNIEPHVLGFIFETAFYAEISRRVEKVSTMQIPTAAVTWSKERDCLTMLYNPVFFASLTALQVRGVIKHEFDHLIFGHLAERRKTPHKLWNLATDAAINSLIYEWAKLDVRKIVKDPYNPSIEPLPEFAILPGRAPVNRDGKKMTAEEKAAAPLAAIIEAAPPLLSSEEYMTLFQQELAKHPQSGQCNTCKGSGKVPKKKGDPGAGSPSDKGEKTPGGDQPDDSGEGGDQPGEGCGHNHDEDGEEVCPDCDGSGQNAGGGGIGPMDDHNPWDEIDEDMREYVENRIRQILEDASNVADQTSTGWGNIPAHMVAALRKYLSRKVHWKSVLRQFIGTVLPGDRTTSIKRINRRYPYVHPGVKRSRRPGLLIPIDMSGSVSNELLSLFFAELGILAQNCDIDILPFDCACDEKEIYRWRKGQQLAPKRTRSGGTDFNAPTDLVNKYPGRWDGLLILTDGCAPAPGPCKVRRGWVLGPNDKLYFDSSELQVFVDNQRPMKGAWR
jgi:predicted metal-dependent peptidase